MRHGLMAEGITNTINRLADQGWGSASKLWRHVRGTRGGEILGITRAADASGIPGAHRVGNYHFSDAPGSQGYVPGDGSYHRYIVPTGINSIIIGPASGQSGTLHQGGIKYGEGGRHTLVDVRVSPPGMVVEVKAFCMSGQARCTSDSHPGPGAQTAVSVFSYEDYLTKKTL